MSTGFLVYLGHGYSLANPADGLSRLAMLLFSVSMERSGLIYGPVRMQVQLTGAVQSALRALGWVSSHLRDRLHLIHWQTPLRRVNGGHVLLSHCCIVSGAFGTRLWRVGPLRLPTGGGLVLNLSCIRFGLIH